MSGYTYSIDYQSRCGFISIIICNVVVVSDIIIILTFEFCKNCKRIDSNVLKLNILNFKIMKLPVKPKELKTYLFQSQTQPWYNYRGYHINYGVDRSVASIKLTL